MPATAKKFSEAQLRFIDFLSQVLDIKPKVRTLPVGTPGTNWTPLSPWPFDTIWFGFKRQGQLPDYLDYQRFFLSWSPDEVIICGATNERWWNEYARLADGSGYCGGTCSAGDGPDIYEGDWENETEYYWTRSWIKAAALCMWVLGKKVSKEDRVKFRALLKQAVQQ